MRHSIKISNKGKTYKTPNYDGYVLTWNVSSSQWTPSIVAINFPTTTVYSDGYVSMSGDLSGTYPVPTVISIKGKLV
jgi:hypothetical protein